MILFDFWFEKLIRWGLAGIAALGAEEIEVARQLEYCAFQVRYNGGSHRNDRGRGGIGSDSG